LPYNFQDPEYFLVDDFDPKNRYATISNRYARVCFLVSTESQPVFELLAADDYQVRLALGSEIFESLGVRYIVLVDQKEIPSLPRFEPIGALEGLVVLRHR
jgi:hypothetical protein